MQYTTIFEFSIYRFVTQYSTQHSTQYSVGAWRTINKLHIYNNNNNNDLVYYTDVKANSPPPRLPASPPWQSASQCHVEGHRWSRRHILSYIIISPIHLPRYFIRIPHQYKTENPTTHLTPTTSISFILCPIANLASLISSSAPFHNPRGLVALYLSLYPAIKAICIPAPTKIQCSPLPMPSWPLVDSTSGHGRSRMLGKSA